MPTGGPHTNDAFEEMRQHPTSQYSLTTVYTMALMATSEQPVRGDAMFWNESDQTWTLLRTPPGGRERKIIVQMVQVTHGGSIQFRFLDVAARLGWRSTYLPTAALVRSAGKKKP
jgi:hypothetical protein